MFNIPQSAAYVVMFKAFLASDHVTEATGKTIVMTISKNGGAFATLNVGGTVNATEVSTGWYKVSLDTTDTATLGPIAVRGTNADIDDVGLLYNVTDLNAKIDTIDTVVDSIYTAVVTNAAGTDIAADIIALKAETASIQSDTNDLQTRVPAALVSGKMDSSVSAVTAAGLSDFFDTNSGTTYASAVAGSVVKEIADNAGSGGGGPTAAAIAAAVWDLDATGHTTTGTFGAAIGDPVADTNSIFKAVVTDATLATVGLDVVAVKTQTAAIEVDTAEIGTAGAGLTNINLPNQTMDIIGNITGNVSGSVGSVTTVGSVTGSVGSVTGAVGSVAANGITASSLAADASLEIADALLTRDMSAVSEGSGRTPLQALRVLRNKWDITAGTLTVTKENDSTTSWTAAVTGTAGADPITTVDPA